MALQKAIKQEDGVTTSYHRVLFIQSMVNSHVSIAVVSYVDNEARGWEKGGDATPYRKSITYETDYDEGMTIEKAYNYLKTLPEFEGAEDA